VTSLTNLSGQGADINLAISEPAQIYSKYFNNFKAFKKSDDHSSFSGAGGPITTAIYGTSQIPAVKKEYSHISPAKLKMIKRMPHRASNSMIPEETAS